MSLLPETSLPDVHPRPLRAILSLAFALALAAGARAEDKEVEDTIDAMVGPLTKKYEDRLAARDRLAAMGKRAVPALEKLLTAQSQTKLIWGMRTLVKMDDERPRLLPTFLSYFRHADDFVREDAVRLCAKFAGDDETVRKAVLAATGDKAPGVRLRAFSALKGWAEASPPWEPAAPCFRASLRDPSPYVRMNMVRDMKIDPAKPDEDALRMATQDPDGQVRAQAIKILGLCQGTKVGEALAAALNDRDELPRLGAFAALRDVFRFNPDAEVAKKVLPAVLGKLGAKEPYVRRDALSVLSDMGPLARDGAPRVRAMLGDPDPSVRTYAADVLKKIDPK